MTLRRIYDKTDRVIVPTLRMKSLMLSYMIEKPLMIIPTGISKSEFEGVSKVHERSHSNFFKQFPILVGKKILLYAGRIGWEKNLNFLVDMLGRVVQEQPNTVLLIAGDGPYREDMEHLIHRRGLSHNVVFAGIVPKKEMKKVYALADVFVFSSKVETQGLVTIEAMICGTPVVAIGEMGTRDVMSGNNGGFMTHDDLGEFTRRVLQLLTDEKLYWKKSHEAMLHAEAYTIERFAKMTTDLYDSLVVQKRHRKKNYQDRIREMWRGLA
jgi:glycosyltransferase involved in cell wall biosynthesis